MYIEKGIQRVYNFIDSGEHKEAMMLLRDIEANVVRYDFEILGDGFSQFAELYVTKNNRKKALEMYQKAILYYRETNKQDKIQDISERFEKLIL